MTKTPSDTGETPNPVETPQTGENPEPVAAVQATDGDNPLLQAVDEKARKLARALLRTASFGALGVLRPHDGAPAVSRTLLATDFEGCPILLVSALSAHTKALRGDPRCSLLVGKEASGDPLASPRLGVDGRAAFVGRDSDERNVLRERFLNRHPKSALYIDFPDFSFVRVEPESASLIGGFGRAYELAREDLVDASAPDLFKSEAGAREHMNEDHRDAIDAIAAAHGGKGSGWTICSMDRRGFEIARDDDLRRIEFEGDAAPAGYRQAFVSLFRATQQT